MADGIGVLFQDDVSLYRLLTDKGISERIPHPMNTGIEGMYDTIESHGIARLWVYPGTDLSQRIKYGSFADIDRSKYDFYTPPQNVYDGSPFTIKLRAIKPGGYFRYVIFPEHMECGVPQEKNKGQWILPSPYHLLRTVSYLEQELNTPIMWTAGKTGEEILRGIHEARRNKAPIKPLPIALGYQWDVVSKGAMDRLIWKCLIPITSPYWNRKYIVGFDKNGQYTGGALSSDLGNGGFHEVSSFIKGSCGFWKYHGIDVADTPFNGVELPCPLDVKRQWASTALIEVAHKVGVHFEIDYGIVWPEHSQYLEKWAETMWRHRVAFRDSNKYPDLVAAKNAECSVKLYTNSTQGRFKNEYSKEYNHPDWITGIVHRSTANQVYTLAFLLQTYALSPVLICKDALYFLSDNPNPHEFAHGYMVKYQEQLRGYKPIGVCSLTDDIKELFVKQRTSVGDIEEGIKKAMRRFENGAA